MSAAAAERDETGSVVEEVVDRGRLVRLRRHSRRVSARDGAPLVVIDKEPLEGATGLPCLLVHGLRGTRASFDLSTRALSSFLVEAGHRVYVAELRGSGRSREAGSPPARGIRDLLELDLPALVDLAGEDGPDGIALVGHSLGALLSCLAAARAPEQVSSVVALAPPHSPGRGQGIVKLASRAWVALGESPRGRAVVESSSMNQVLVTGRRVLDRWPLPLPRSRTVWPGSMEPAAQAELEAAQGREPAFPGLLTDLARMTAGLEPTGLEVDRELSRLRAPVLALVGDRDEIAPPEAALTLQDVVGKAPCEVRVVGDDGGHVGHADLVLGRRAPELVWEPALAWIERRG